MALAEAFHAYAPRLTDEHIKAIARISFLDLPAVQPDVILSEAVAAYDELVPELSKTDVRRLAQRLKRVQFETTTERQQYDWLDGFLFVADMSAMPERNPDMVTVKNVVAYLYNSGDVGQWDIASELAAEYHLPGAFYLPGTTLQTS
jgi:hypothetical protein